MKLAFIVTLALCCWAASAEYCPEASQLHTAALTTPEGKIGVSVSWAVHHDNGNPADYVPDLNMNDYPTTCLTKNYWKNVYHYSCRILGLAPSTRYSYSVGNKLCSQGRGVSQLYTVAGPSTPSTTVLLGDMGLENSDDTMERLQRALASNLRPDTPVIHVGDISYGDDKELFGENPEYEPIYDDYMKKIQSIAHKHAYMVAAGNHDVTCHIIGDGGCPPQLRNFSAYINRWDMNHQFSGSPTPLWYSFNHGDVHFVAINTESDYPLAPYKPTEGSALAGGFGDQLRWLEQDLSYANTPGQRKLRPWIVVYGHRPVYSTSSLEFPLDQQEKVKKTFEPLFHRYGVDVYIAGHVHLYERTYPMVNETSTATDYNNPKATVYINNGAAGNVEGHCNRYKADLPPYIPIRDVKNFGFGIVTTYNSSSLSSSSPLHSSHSSSSSPIHNPNMRKLCYDFIASTPGIDKPLDTFCITKDIATRSFAQPMSRNREAIFSPLPVLNTNRRIPSSPSHPHHSNIPTHLIRRRPSPYRPQPNQRIPLRTVPNLQRRR